MSTGPRQHYLADFERVAGILPGARVSWLARMRAGALEVFAERGFPTRRDEEWKYTSLAPFEKHAFRAAPQAGLDAEAAATIARFMPEKEAGRLLVFLNGRHAPALSSIARLPEGVALESLDRMLESMPHVLEPYLVDEDSAFGALNTAFMADGAYLHLKRGSTLEEPLHLLFIATEAGSAIHTRNLIVAEEGAQASVIEHYVGLEGRMYFTNAVTRIFAAPNARVEHHKLQQEADDAFHVAGIHAIQQRDSRLASHSFTLGGALTRNDIGTAFDASGCEAVLNGLYLAGGNQHVDNHTYIDHRQPHGTSHENYRGVLDGQAHAVFNGKVIVHPGAQKTDASQINHNLLLSLGAEIDTKPQLEIFADDVKCNHGATVGRLDEAQLFYLRSRGLEETAARNLLVHAFARDVIERVRIASLRDRIEQLLPTHLREMS